MRLLLVRAALGVFPLMVPWGVNAQTMSAESGFTPTKHDGIVVTCPYALNPVALCSSVSNKIKDKDQSGPYQYLYQRQVYEAACVNLDVDGDDVIAKKVGDFWDSNAERLVCDSTQFNVPNGSILKFAVAKVFSDFIADAIQIWRIDLNQVDASDGRTVLDYVDGELERQQGSPNEATLRHYRNELRKAGAKHAGEVSWRP